MFDILHLVLDLEQQIYLHFCYIVFISITHTYIYYYLEVLFCCLFVSLCSSG